MVGIVNDKLPISVGILSWQSDLTLRNTLNSYNEKGLFDIVDDATIFFQETSDRDREIASRYGVPFLESEENQGIGWAFVALAKNARHENILLLEHDWVLTEGPAVTRTRLAESIKMLDRGYSAVRLRNRWNPGYPLFSQAVYQGRELEHYCPVTELTAPHLMDCVHWIEDPDLCFPDQIKTDNYHYVTTSRWSNWNNNPCLFKREFYIKTVTPFLSKGDLLLEDSMNYWWARQDFKIAWGEGLFTHRDIGKYE